MDLVASNTNVLIFLERKTDEFFPISQFLIDGSLSRRWK